MLLAVVALSALVPATVFAGGPPAPVANPEGFAEVRARFEGKTYDEIRAMGYVAEPPVCVAAPGLGGMGVHAINGAEFGRQFESGKMDPENPVIVLMSADLKHVIGLEWEAADVGQGETELFGQAVVLQPGHEGPPPVQKPHYMLHAYFRADAQVLFAPFDPEATCAPDTSTVGSRSSAVPAPLLVALGLALVGLGVLSTRRRATRPI
jgi:hypothetical protein